MTHPIHHTTPLSSSISPLPRYLAVYEWCIPFTPFTPSLFLLSSFHHSNYPIHHFPFPFVQLRMEVMFMSRWMWYCIHSFHPSLLHLHFHHWSSYALHRSILQWKRYRGYRVFIHTSPISSSSSYIHTHLLLIFIYSLIQILHCIIYIYFYTNWQVIVLFI